ncbi:MAG: hypothetical protein AAGC64_10440 [Bacteroidota bacterium]
MQSSIFLLSIITFFVVGIPENIQKTQDERYADVLNVTISGKELQYTFSVTISSPDTGCEQYADWWEVISESGELVYRRVLLHSHVNEQPFTRSGGKVPIKEDQIVWIRAHMNNLGYGGKTIKGSVTDGFVPTEPPKGFAANLEQVQPLPSGCGF